MKHIITKEAYLAIKQQWKQNAHHSAAEIVIYNLLRGFPADRGFAPLKNPNKINNSISKSPWIGYNRAVEQAQTYVILRDLTDEHWAKKYPPTVKKDIFGRIVSENPIMSEYGYKSQQRAILSQKGQKERFFHMYAQELDQAMSYLLVAGLKEVAK
jgi:hypothetical protein